MGREYFPVTEYGQKPVTKERMCNLIVLMKRVMMVMVIMVVMVPIVALVPVMAVNSYLLSKLLYMWAP